MNRAFLSLYGFIVISVIAVGWGLDKLWEYYSPQDDVDLAQQKLMQVVGYQLGGVETEDIHNRAVELSRYLDSQIDVFHIDEMARSSLMEQINQGEVVVLYGEQGELHLYQQIKGADFVLRLVLPANEASKSPLYDLLLIIFYASIALVVFLWVWPLSRDLRKLERLTAMVGKDKLPDKLDVFAGSAVYSVADAFNRMAERIKELLATQKELTYAVSHELRTPLARMKFGLEMAQDTKELDRVKEQIKGVREDVSEMEGLVSSLLTYASYEQEKDSLNLQSGDMAYLINLLIQQIKEGSEKPGVALEFDNQMACPEVVCEWRLMECIILNLIQNALRFAKSRVRVSLSENDGFYCLNVDDDGPGIPEEDRERVFQSFVRLTNSSNGKNRGFGLGLALVKRIIHWHRGSVSAELSDLGGARFVVQWPQVTESTCDNT